MFRRNDSGVSPTVSVILMVAVTVILAAAIYTLVFGISDGTDAGSQVAVEISEEIETSNIHVQLIDKGNAQSVLIKTPGVTRELTEVGDSISLFTSDMKVIAVSKDGGETLVRDYKAKSFSNIQYVVKSDSEWNNGTFTDTEVGSLLLNTSQPKDSYKSFGVEKYGSEVYDIQTESDIAYILTENNIVKKNISTGNTKWAVSHGTKYMGSESLSITTDGNIGLTSNETHLYDSDGNKLWEKTGYSSITAAPSGDLYVSSYNDIIRLNGTNGDVKWKSSIHTQRRDLETDSNGNVYGTPPSSTNTQPADVIKVNSSGSQIYDYDLPSIPDELAVTDSGEAYVMDGSTIIRLDKGGNKVWEKTDSKYYNSKNLFYDNGNLHSFNDFEYIKYDTSLNIVSTISYNSEASRASHITENGVLTSDGKNGVEYVLDSRDGSYQSKVFSPNESVAWNKMVVETNTMASNVQTGSVSVTFADKKSNLGDVSLEKTINGKETNINFDENSGVVLNENPLSYTYEIAAKSNATYVTQYGTFSKLSSDLSNKKWEKNFGGYSVAVNSNHNIFIGTPDGVVKRLNASGGVVWETNISSGELYDVELYNGNVYVAGAFGTNKIHRLDASTGTEDSWSANLTEVKDISIRDGAVYGAGYRYVKKFNISTETEDTKFTIDTKSTFGSELALYSLQVDSNNNVYVGGGWTNGRYFKTNSSGELLWQTTVGDNMVYDIELNEDTNNAYSIIGGNANKLVEFNPTTGAENWTSSNPANWVRDVAIGPKDTIYASNDNSVRKLISPDRLFYANHTRFSISLDSHTDTSPVIEKVIIQAEAQDSK